MFKNQNKHIIYPILLLMLLALNKQNAAQTTDSVYVNEIKTFHQKRINNLKKEEGWLNLAGRFLLHEGSNTIGSGKKNTIVFPKGKSAKNIGNILVKDNTVSIEINKGVEVWNAQKERVSKQLVYTNDTADPVVLYHQSLNWHIIKRGNDFYLRLRDLEHENLKKFTDVPTYPIDAQWKVEAILDTTIKDSIEITNILGNVSNQASAGKLRFSVNGKQYTLDALDEDENLFIIFADETNNSETYYTGRFLTVPKPDKNGTLYLDFNKSVNPPCAFTDFATCPLPPKQNVLPVNITAGEKRYGNH